MDLLLSEVQLPVRLRTATPMSDLEMMRFSTKNETLRIEREANGELLVMSSSGFGSGLINGRITRLIGEWAEKDGRGLVTDSNGGYTLADGSVRAPDAAWVAKRRVERLSPAERAGFAPICPEFVIELRSASDRLAELQEKMKLWIANGAELAWLIDPERRVVEVYRPGEAAEVHEDPTSVQGDGPVRGFELVLARVWG